MKRLNLIPLILIASLMAAGAAFAESDYASSPDPSFAAFGARPLGLGGAYVALSDDSNAIFTNPAGLSQLPKWEITSMSTRLMDRIDYKLMEGQQSSVPGCSALDISASALREAFPGHRWAQPSQQLP